ncbi:MAG TPA: hypothetical protein VFQ42_04245 [Mycobacterium sp.]|nr:hypothetical protein [Mycobacterium sp.]
MTDYDKLIAELRRWTADHDDHVRAAVQLLIDHDYWLRTSRFVRAAVVKAEDGRYIIWRKAREAFDAGEFDRSSTTELAVLDLAIALGENRYKLDHMGTANSASIAAAVQVAAGVRPR